MNPKLSVYRNLHKDCWSVQQSGEKVWHTQALLIGGPEFVVQPAGNARVRREHKKNVHAFVRAPKDRVRSLRTEVAFALLGTGEGWHWVTYNPYENVSFVWDNRWHDPIYRARQALLTPDGKVYVRLTSEDKPALLEP